MKKLFLLIGCFCLLTFAKAQYWGWSDPVPVTDSLHFNRNISMNSGWDMTGEEVWAAWEVADDTLSTAIWCRDIKLMGDQFQVLGYPGIHYRNPQVIQIQSGDTLFYLYYETDQTGNWDIMYVGYLGNGMFSDPVIFWASPDDDMSFVYVYSRVVWVSGGDLCQANYQIPGGFLAGIQLQVIDTGGCMNPVFNGNKIAWEKPDGNDVRIWASFYDVNEFSSPELIVNQGLNRHLTLGSGIQGSELLWQTMVSGTWEIAGATLPFNDPLEVPQLVGFNNIQPVYSHMYVVDGTSYPFDPGMLTVASDSSGNYEIYAFEEFWYPYFVNLSLYPTDDLNPALFLVWNLEPQHGNLILTWESNRNGHWQIWMRNLDIFTATPEMPDPVNNSEIQGIPNPFSTKTSLEFNALTIGSFQIQIYSTQGKEVLSRTWDVHQPGSQQFEWDGKNQSGELLPKGIYVVLIKSDDQLLSGKIIFQP